MAYARTMFWAGTVTAAMALTLAPSLQAQEEEDGPWEWQGEVGASLFFGAAEQTAVTLRGTAERTSQLLELSLGSGFAYGEAQNPETGESFVNKRSWSGDAALDYRPQSHFSPFVFGSAEGGLERQIDLRVSGGAGAKYRFVQSDRARLDLSLAALAERTDPRTAPGVDDQVETKGRWSLRLRAAREFGDGRTSFNVVSFYRPAFQEPSDDYTVDLEASLGFNLNDTVALKLSFVDRYDSLAETRGAASNNDGRLFVSLVARGD